MRLKSAVLLVMFFVVAGCGSDEPASSENGDTWELENQGDPDAGLDADDGDAEELDVEDLDVDEADVDADEGDADEGDADEADADEADADEADADEADADEADADVDSPSCDDGVLNGDETDLDCGGSCDGCEEGLSCAEDSDCESDHCHEEICVAPRLDLGEVCEEDFQCGSELCEEIGEEQYCTEVCDASCSQGGVACFDGLCVPEDYCSDASGFGDGPGCEGTACDQCHEGATCVQAGDGFECNCREGYVGDGVICEDIDECAEGLDSCHDLAACVNTPGGYLCECEEGYDGDGFTCSDINECLLGIDECGENAFCVNVAGGYGCSCPAGYEGNPWEQCSDIDECALGTNSCDANATCTNTSGSYLCECDDGFEGNGYNCTDLDECALGTDSCDVNATCTNTQGSYECECHAGYVGDGESCYIVGESCDAAFMVGALPYAHASDTSPMSNQYTVDPYWCEGLNYQIGGTNGQVVYSFTPDETTFYRIAVESEFDAGIFVVTDCGELASSCVAGVDESPYAAGGIEVMDLEMEAGQTYFIVVSAWAGSVSGIVAGAFEILVDANECLNGTASCDVSVCEKGVDEGYECVCSPPGYEEIGGECFDVDECAQGIDSCPSDATCFNTVGSYMCLCGIGSAGEPLTCDDPALEGNSCLNPFVIEGADLPFEVEGDTTSRGNAMSTRTDDCPGTTWSLGGASDDQVYAFTPDSDGDYVVTLESASGFDSALYVVTDCEDVAGSCLGADDKAAEPSVETLTLSMTSGTTYFIVVDGWSSAFNESGTYELRVEEAP